jgi:hypothetical protein
LNLCHQDHWSLAYLRNNLWENHTVFAGNGSSE